MPQSGSLGVEVSVAPFALRAGALGNDADAEAAARLSATINEAVRCRCERLLHEWHGGSSSRTCTERSV